MSRLDRLVLLLDSGSSAFIRNTAADQLAESAKNHPEEILNILARVYPYLKSRKWETRISAARAFGGIISNAQPWNPNEIVEPPQRIIADMDPEDEIIQNSVKQEDSEYENIKKEDPEEEFRKLKEVLSVSDNIKLEDLNFSKLIEDCPKLVASGEPLLDLENNKGLIENLRLLKQLLNARLGAGDPNILIVQQRENKRIKQEQEEKLRKKKELQDEQLQKQVKIEQPTPVLAAEISKGSAARLRAMARRRAKVAAASVQTRNSPVDLSQSSLSNKKDGESTVMKLEPSKFEITSQADTNKIVMETKVSNISFEQAGVSSKVWLFQGLYELLVFDLFNPNWEIRHGSALGLKELLKKHAKSINRMKEFNQTENDDRNLAALEDLTAKILTLFALDRFGDYISDNVVAPVRESTGQALAALLANIDENNPKERDLLIKIFNKLIELVIQDPNVTGLKHNCWEAAHGGILGLKYIVSIKSNFIFSDVKVYESIINVVLDGLQNHVEEIQSESAALLIPAIDYILLHENWLKKILSIIWQILESITDDLKSSLNNILNLISCLLQYPQVLELMKQMSSENGQNHYSLESLIPKLYPFLRHSISNIRRSVLLTFLSFSNIEDSDSDVGGFKWYQDSLLLRLIFQNLIFEQHADIMKLSENVFQKILEKNRLHDQKIGNMATSTIEKIFAEHLLPLFSLITVPLGINRLNYAMNYSDVMRPNGQTMSKPQTSSSNNNGNGESKRGKKRKASTEDTNNEERPLSPDLHVNIDAPILNGDITLLGIDVFVQTRISAAKNFGIALGYFNFDQEVIKNIFDKFRLTLNSSFLSPRIFTAITIESFFSHLKSREIAAPLKLAGLVEPILISFLNDSEKLPFFRELVPSLKSLRSNCFELFLRFEENGGVPNSKIPLLPIVCQGEKQAGTNAFTVQDAEKVINVYYAKLSKHLNAASKFTATEVLEKSSLIIRNAIGNIIELRNSRNVTLLACYASAGLSILTALPPKLNPYIRCLMDSIKTDSELYQNLTAEAVADLIYRLVAAEKPKIFEKMIKNLCSYLCVQFPEFELNQQTSAIFSLENQKLTTKLHNETTQVLKVLGSKTTLYHILDHYGESIFGKLTGLKQLIFKPLEILKEHPSLSDEVYKDFKISQSVIDSLGLIEWLTPKLAEDVMFENLQLDVILNGLKSEFAVFRYSAAKCLAALCKQFPNRAIPFTVTQVLPLLKNSGDVHHRQGAIEAIYHLSTIMEVDILPYVIFFIVPVLGRMSDSDPDIRVIATTTFASIIKLVPLEAGITDPPNMPAELLVGRERERSFIKELLNPSEIPEYPLPISIQATLRSYQRSGVNWLHFLNRYNLHGILCDDMGLGKTLQTICIVASDHHDRIEKFAETKSDEYRKIPSLVVCPPSVMGHWEQEIHQYAPFLKVLVYAGSPSVRTPLRSLIDDNDVIVTSYDVMRNDSEFIATKLFNYAVLDEGHIIKNSHSKLSKSVKLIKAEHRLVLTGTPIQNNVLELWSLFDFLMPGFLGTEKFFQEKFSKPIAASRNSRTSTKEQEQGALALEALHKQVLPFMLRRLKSEVLSDLPPKIIQDRYCELSEIQKALYRDFAKKQKPIVEADIENAVGQEEEGKKGPHIFQALNYMRKLCNHPSFVLSKDHPNYNQIQKYLAESKSDIDDIRNAPKLLDLKNLLIECGIGGSSSTSKKLTQKQQKQLEQQQLLQDGVISQHRALIFCQQKEMLEKVENDLFKKHLPGVTYMRLDGGTDPRMRQQLVQKFNSDPSIDVLLLTTRVGGLGLNLTGADTVIFVEHDWNPMNDLQAMDRAHRLGQTKAVNVYRLITRNTLEEKIMSLQKFKVNVASAVVNQQNNNINSMDTNQLLDLFDVDDKDTGADKKDDAADSADVDELGLGSGLGSQAKSALGALTEMWDNSQYEDEYNVKNFVKSLK